MLISQRGIARVARDMRANSRITKTRQAWIEAVGDVVEACFNSEIRYLTEGVDRAIKRAKSSAGHRCEITGRKAAVHKKIDLDGHHLFDRRSRPDLADLPENILVLVPDLHREFHGWKSGPCTPKDVLAVRRNRTGGSVRSCELPRHETTQGADPPAAAFPERAGGAEGEVSPKLRLIIGCLLADYF